MGRRDHHVQCRTARQRSGTGQLGAAARDCTGDGSTCLHKVVPSQRAHGHPHRPKLITVPVLGITWETVPRRGRNRKVTEKHFNGVLQLRLFERVQVHVVLAGSKGKHGNPLVVTRYPGLAVGGHRGSRRRRGPGRMWTGRQSWTLLQVSKGSGSRGGGRK